VDFKVGEKEERWGRKPPGCGKGRRGGGGIEKERIRLGRREGVWFV